MKLSGIRYFFKGKKTEIKFFSEKMFRTTPYDNGECGDALCKFSLNPYSYLRIHIYIYIA